MMATMSKTAPQDSPVVKQSLEPSGPCVMVVFGAAGDLTKRKLIPALHNLISDGLLPEQFAVVGFSRDEIGGEQFRDRLKEQLSEFVSGRPERWEWIAKRLYYVQGNFREPEAYRKLQEVLAKVDHDHGTQGNYFYYLATPPSFFGDIVKQLGAAGLVNEENGCWRRIVIEKPFGRDYDSAVALNRTLQKTVKEPQIYRIDHYLGKETVQNILVFRFANGIFEPVWNRRYIDHVQITVTEELGVEHRGAYYEEAGALRDMVSNHVMQLLAYTTMEPPNSFDAEAVRNEKAKILQAIQPLRPEEVLTQTVRGQYGEGKLTDGSAAQAYRSEPLVAPDSKTETYVALKLMLDNWRWVGVPFYIRTGKRMPKRMTEIAIHFKQVPFTLFRDTPIDSINTNVLVIRIQPNEGIALSFGAKVPGPVMQIGNMEMDFCYADYFGGKPLTGYETLLYDGMKGDATLFLRGDNVEYAWNALTPILDVWRTLPPRDFPNYAAGSWGPAGAEKLLADNGCQWRNGT